MVDAELHGFADEKRIRAAICDAEKSTDASITVWITPHVDGDIHAAALRSLHALRRARTAGHAAVHFFVVPSRREFAVVGNAKAHERLGQAAWDSAVAIVEKHFREGDATAALVAGIEDVAGHLRIHFPTKLTSQS